MHLKTTGKILLVTRNFPPLMGGMEKLIFNVFNQLKNHFNVKIVGPKGCEDFSDRRVLYTFPHEPAWKFLITCQFTTFRGVTSYRPDLIISGSGLTVPAAMIAGKFFNTPVITYLHGLDIVTNSKIYQNFFIPLIRCCDGIVVNSSYTALLAQKIGIENSKIHILHPGTHIPHGFNNRKSSNEFRETINAGKRPLLLSVGRLTERKGIFEFLENCMDDIIATVPKILLVIIGGDAEDAVNSSSGMAAKIKNLINLKGFSRHVLMLGKVSDKKLHQAYASSNLLIFPILEQPGDVEGFGMVAIEAAAHGLPTVAFAAGGVTDAVKDGRSGYLIEPGRYDRFSEVIIDLLQSRSTSISETCREFAELFSWPIFGKKLFKVCNTYISN